MKLRWITYLFLFSIIFFTKTSIAGWGTPPEGWDDFKFGLLDGNRSPFKAALSNAVNAGIQIDYSYVYITTLADIEGFLFAPWFNYATSRPGNVKPSITIYMLQQGADAPDGSSAWNSAADKAYMKKYFEGVKQIADSCKGTQPIYVLEPDVWGYLLGQANPQMTDENLDRICHINDLGLSWLSEFDNKLYDLPAALIKTLKMVDPDCYVGILMAHWGFPDDLAGAKADGELSGEYINKFLQRTDYRGDFIGVEKNGTDAGSWGSGSSWYWSEAKNEAYLGWCKALGQKVDLPLFGWQICSGYDNVPGYPELPNTSGRYEDTYFQYFFNNVEAFIDAGFIGFDAGCNNQGHGTWYSMEEGQGDNGWFLDRLKEFNTDRPYELNIVSSSNKESYLIKKQKNIAEISNGQLIIDNSITLSSHDLVIDIYNSLGRKVNQLFEGPASELDNVINLARNLNLGAGVYWISISDNRSINSKIPWIITK